MFNQFKVCIVLASIATTGVANATVLSEWNLIVRHDLTSTSEVDGSALIGGNLSGTSNYAIAGATATNNDGLAIGGDIISPSNVQINNGANLRITGVVQAGSMANLNGGGTQINDPSVSALIDDAFTEIEAISASLASLPANGTLDNAGNLTATPTLIDGKSVAVYNLSNADLQGLGQLNLVKGSAESIVINLFSSVGNVDLIAPPNIIGDFNKNNSSKILWNLPDATNIQINNSFNGALIAPFANLSLLGGGINGTVAVNSFSNMQAEVRSFIYTGYTPEPTSLLLMGLGGVLLWRRR